MIMKTYQTLLTLLFVSFTLTSNAAPADFVSTPLFFQQALQDYNREINQNSIELSEDLSEISEVKKNNFKAKATVQNTLEAEYQTYLVEFELNQHKVQCLGAVFPIDHSIMRTEQGQDFQNRSGMVYLSECDVTFAENNENFPPNFEIKQFIAFPKVESLPIAAGSSLERFHLTKEVVAEDKIFQCISSDLNAFEMPRNSVSVYNTEEHYAVGIHVASSATDFDTIDIPVNVAEIDLGSIEWVKDNINFFTSLGSEGSSAFNVVFKKEDCRIVGPEDTVTVMQCRLDIPNPENRVKKIERVVFNFETQGVTKPRLVNSGEESEITFENTMFHKVNVEFIVNEPNKYHPIFEKTVYRNSLEYWRSSEKGHECRFKSELPKPPQQVTPSSSPYSNASFDL